MERARLLVFLLSAGLVYMVPEAYGHQCGHHGCAGCGGGCEWGHRHHGSRAQRSSYRDRGRGGGVPAAEQAREGKVTEVTYLPGATKDAAMVEIRLLAGTEEILARLGPSGYLHQYQMDVREGDTVRVSGYWVTAAGGDMLVATRVARQGNSVPLRDSWGRPAW
jgi:ribosomal protein S28E/S33